MKSKDGVVQKDPRKVMEIIHGFYKDLWQDGSNISENEENEYLNNIKPLFAAHEHISPFINEEEMDDSFKGGFKKDTSPGPDGTTYEFYEANWDTVKPDLLQVYNNAFISGKLPKSMYETHVKLTPKKGDLTKLKIGGQYP